jgi:hypothetical protein
MKHPKGSTGTSLGGRLEGKGRNSQAREKRFIERQQRLSGKCKVIYDRESGEGAIPPNLRKLVPGGT